MSLLNAVGTTDRKPFTALGEAVGILPIWSLSSFRGLLCREHLSSQTCKRLKRTDQTFFSVRANPGVSFQCEMWTLPGILFSVHFITALMFFTGVTIHPYRTRFHRSRVKSIMMLNLEKMRARLRRAAACTEITPRWARRPVLFSVSLLWVNTMM